MAEGQVRPVRAVAADAESGVVGAEGRGWEMGDRRRRKRPVG